MRLTPQVLSVDDFAFSQGRRYGTLLVDLEQHRLLDLLHDRSAQTLVGWLAAHPGVEAVSRDCGGNYADGGVAELRMHSRLPTSSISCGT
jgi:transposase